MECRPARRAMAALLRLRLGLEEDYLFAAVWDGDQETASQWVKEYLPEHIENPGPIIDELVLEWGSTRRTADRMVRRIAGAPSHFVAEAATARKRQASQEERARGARACVAAGVSSAAAQPPAGTAPMARWPSTLRFGQGLLQGLRGAQELRDGRHRG